MGLYERLVGFVWGPVEERLLIERWMDRQMDEAVDRKPDECDINSAGNNVSVSVVKG